MKKIFILLMMGLFLVGSVIAQDKFTQTFVIRIGGAFIPAGEETIWAKFDMIDCKRSHYNDIDGDTWAAVKAINPNAEIFLYQMGRNFYNTHDAQSIEYLNDLGRYDVSRGHSMGNLNVDNDHLFLEYLYVPPEYQDRKSVGDRVTENYGTAQPIMDVGHPDFQDYWVEATLNDMVGQPWEPDGVFADVVGHRRINFCSTLYCSADDSVWAAAMEDFINAVTVGLGAQGQKLWCNTEHMRTQHDYDAYISLDNSANPPYAILSEGSFVSLWGPGDVQFYVESIWKLQLDILVNIRNMRMTSQSSTALYPGESTTDNWGKPVEFWDILWYAMSSFHLGKNTVDNNSYFGFLSNNYSNAVWYDEYDYIDLGEALDTYKIDDSSGNNIYWREFEKGYVYVNPTRYDVSSITLPETCKQLNHNNFMNDPTTIADINTINLDSHRGTMLLKSDVQIETCQDNHNCCDACRYGAYPEYDDDCLVVCCDVCSTPPSTCPLADEDDSNSISIQELIAFIGEWKNGSATIQEVIEVIGLWKSGC